MNPHPALVGAALALLTLTACSGGPSATSAAPASSAATSATATATTSATATGTQSSAAGSSSSATTSYTLADVATHNTQSDCWAAIDGGVYNLTEWINRHPGGRDKIIALCGTDATKAFHGQHDDQAKPNTQLASFKVGELAG